MLMFLFFLLLWICFNGRCTPDVLIVGVVLSAVVTVFAVKVCGWSVGMSRRVFRGLPKILTYFFLLVFEIISANVATIKVILARDPNAYRPQIFQFDSRLRRPFMWTILANSITITPGTYTIGIDQGHLTVHALNDKFANETSGNRCNRLLMRIEAQLDGKNAEDVDGQTGDADGQVDNADGPAGISDPKGGEA